MDLTVRGGTKPQRQLARLIARNITPKLIGKRLYQKISLDIIIRSNLFKRHQMYGSCDWIDHSERPKFYEIELDGAMPFKMVILTLCHELVHLKQFAKGELKDYALSEKARWKQKIIDTEMVEYADRPWEKEAYRLESVLYKKLVKSPDDKILNKIKFIKNNW